MPRGKVFLIRKKSRPVGAPRTGEASSLSPRGPRRMRVGSAAQEPFKGFVDAVGRKLALSRNETDQVTPSIFPFLELQFDHGVRFLHNECLLIITLNHFYKSLVEREGEKYLKKIEAVRSSISSSSSYVWANATPEAMTHRLFLEGRDEGDRGKFMPSSAIF